MHCIFTYNIELVLMEMWATEPPFLPSAGRQPLADSHRGKHDDCRSSECIDPFVRAHENPALSLDKLTVHRAAWQEGDLHLPAVTSGETTSAEGNYSQPNFITSSSFSLLF